MNTECRVTEELKQHEQKIYEQRANIIDDELVFYNQVAEEMRKIIQQETFNLSGNSIMDAIFQAKSEWSDLASFQFQKTRDTTEALRYAAAVIGAVERLFKKVDSYYENAEIYQNRAEEAAKRALSGE